ncbi:MAG: anaerobic ribonucleoside-triphosphate reductase activating protein [Thermodesulfobacteriota bacterium]
MLLGGLQKHSLIDYPGKTSCVCFLSGCNFHCPYCHNPELALGRPAHSSLLTEEMFFTFLEARVGLLDGVVISGGEPTLHNRLPSFFDQIKGMGYAVKLDTNGSRPWMIRDLLEQGLVDYMAMDLKTSPEDYGVLMNGDCKVEDILASAQIIMESKIPYEFRTTCVKPFVTPGRLAGMAGLIREAKLYVLQPFHRTRILAPGYFEGMDPGYSESEMHELRAVAEPFVRECRVR